MLIPCCQVSLGPPPQSFPVVGWEQGWGACGSSCTDTGNPPSFPELMAAPSCQAEQILSRGQEKGLWVMLSFAYPKEDPGPPHSAAPRVTWEEIWEEASRTLQVVTWRGSCVPFLRKPKEGSWGMRKFNAISPWRIHRDGDLRL